MYRERMQLSEQNVSIAGNDGPGDSHSPNAPYSADDSPHSNHSAGNSAQIHDNEAHRNPQNHLPAALAHHASHVSEDEVSDSELALPVKHRAKAPTALKNAVKQSKQQPVPQSSDQAVLPQAQHSNEASPVGAGDEDGSDVESPVLPSGGPASAAQKGRSSKKRSKLQLESGDSPTAAQGTALHPLWFALDVVEVTSS